MSVTHAQARRVPGTRRSLRPRHALIAAAGLAVALVGCWYLAFHDVTVARADARAYFSFLGLSQHHLELQHLASRIANLCEAGTYVYLAAVPVTIALLRRRWALALALAVIIPAAPLTCDLLKPLLTAPRPAAGISATPLSADGSWPSGHSAAAMVLGLALALASPSRWRPYAAVAGTVFALGVIYAVLSLGWHYPSDALAGMLVALIWTLLAVAAVLWADGRYGRSLVHLPVETRHWLDHMPSVGAILAFAALVPVVVASMWRGGAAFSYAADHASFVAAAAGLAAVAASAPTALTVVLSGNDRAARAARPVRSPRG